MKHFIFCFVSFTICAEAQISTNGSTDASALVNELLGPRVDLFGNPVLTSSGNSAGTFTGGNSVFTQGSGFDTGIILSTGNIDNIVGPNDESGAGDDLFLDGSTILDNIFADDVATAGITTNDAVSLTFQFTTTDVANLKFNYIFGSEEYNEFVDSFNDVFAFLLTPDTDPTNNVHDAGVTHNIAVLPNTETGGTTGAVSGIVSDGTVVSINNVNNEDNAASYVDNDVNGVTPPANSENHELDGRTVSLEANFDDLPEGIHEITLIIADAVDSVLDSAVFLESNTFFIVPNSPIPLVAGAVQQAGIDASFRDLNSRLLRARAGHTAKAQALMDKESTRFQNDIGNIYDDNYDSSIFSRKLRFFGSAQNYSSTIDGHNSTTASVPSIDIDLFGGNAGLEYTVTESFKIGAGFIHNRGDIRIGQHESLDATFNSFAAYGSFYQPMTKKVDFYADALFGRMEGEFKTSRDFEEFGFTTGSGDTEANYFEGSIGLNIKSGLLIHGPILSYRNSSSDIDSIVESGFAASIYPASNSDTERWRLGYQATARNYSSVGTFSFQGRVLAEAQSSDISTESILSGDGAIIGGAGVIWSFDSGAFMAADWEGRFEDSQSSHHFLLRLGLNF